MARILVIDDEPQIRDWITRILQRATHEVLQAGDGEEGLKMFRTFQPVLVITDLVMPDREGIETIRAMRREAPDIRIIAMSGGGSMPGTYLRMASQLGADATLAKPFRMRELLRTIDRLLVNREIAVDE